MGYTTSWAGRINIDPPVPYATVLDLRESLILWAVVEGLVTSPDGGTTTRHGIGLAPAHEDEWRGGPPGPETLAELATAVRIIGQAHGENRRRFTGVVVCEGEEAGDFWRVRPHYDDDRDLVVERAELRWPTSTVPIDTYAEWDAARAVAAD